MSTGTSNADLSGKNAVDVLDADGARNVARPLREFSLNKTKGPDQQEWLPLVRAFTSMF